MPALPVAAGTSDVAITTDRCVLLGWNFRNTGSSQAKMVLRNGEGGNIIEVINLTYDSSNTIGESDSMDYGPRGIPCEYGVYVDREAGTTEGTIIIR